MSETIKAGDIWPEHADHEVIYSEYGRTDYLAETFIVLYEDEGCVGYSIDLHSERPVDGRIDDSDFWCRTCGVELIAETDKGES